MATDTAPATGPGAHPTPGAVTDLNRVRRLLLGVEAEELAELKARIDDPALRTEAVAEVLAEAVAMRTASDDRLGEALGGTIETALHSSIARDPRPIANAIYPVIGPSVRKAITAALEGMVQSLNQMLEQSLSLRSLRWRFEAWRAGTPFAEYVLLRTLVFRVEQLFLIHAETGLVLRHLSVDPAVERDPAMVSGMLTAIQDFLRDSFAQNDEDGLTRMRLSQGDVLIEAGPYAVLACVVRGEPPPELRPEMARALEQVHVQLGTQLKDFDGDDAPFEAAADLLRPCLMQRTRDPQTHARRRPWPALAMMALILVAAGWYTWEQHRAAAAQAATFAAALAALESEPGYVITHSATRDGVLSIQALRDPAARPHSQVIAGSGLTDGQLSWRETPWQAQHPELVLERARRALQPPDGVDVALAGGVLRLTGAAPADWRERALVLGPVLAGVYSFDASALTRLPTLAERRARLAAAIDATEVAFGVRSAELEAPYTDNLARAAALYAQLRALADDDDAVRLRVIGSSDPSGNPRLNAELSAQRASRVRAFLIDRGVPREHIETVVIAPNANTGRRAYIEVVYRQPSTAGDST